VTERREHDQSAFATFALECTDIDTLLLGACEAAHRRSGLPSTLWHYTDGRLVARSAAGFPGIEEGTFHAEVTKFRPEGKAVTKGEVVIHETVIAAPISLYGRSNRVIAVYPDCHGATGVTDADVTDQIVDDLLHIAAVTSLAQERLYSQRDLANTQKLTELGRIASGIIHEIATPLQFVSNNLLFLHNAFAQLSSGEEINASDRAFLDDETPSAIERSQFGVQRIHDIVSAMKSLSGSQQDFSEVNCNDIIGSCLLIAGHELFTVTVETEFAPSLPSIKGNEGALAQAFLNLVVNAKHAMDDARDSGRQELVLRIETTSTNDHVVIRIADTGLGIPRRIQSRVWEPFFTTKENGVGTGQGLPMVRSIVSNHHGTIEFETGPKGTTFVVGLPVMPG
jgi:signal transduction histidine kinase